MTSAVNLKAAIAKDRLLNIALQALSKHLAAVVGSPVVVTYDNKPKDAIQRYLKSAAHKASASQPKKTSYYPYAILNVGEVGVRKDWAYNLRTMQRHGLHVTNQVEGKTYTYRLFMFPVRVACELHVLLGDPDAALDLYNTLVILSATSGLSFTISFPGYTYSCCLEVPESVSVPIADVGGGESPSGIDVQLSFTLTAYTGFFKPVTAVQSSHPVMTFSIGAEHFGEPHCVTEQIS